MEKWTLKEYLVILKLWKCALNYSVLRWQRWWILHTGKSIVLWKSLKLTTIMKQQIKSFSSFVMRPRMEKWHKVLHTSSWMTPKISPASQLNMNYANLKSSLISTASECLTCVEMTRMEPPLYTAQKTLSRINALGRMETCMKRTWSWFSDVSLPMKLRVTLTFQKRWASY